MLLITVSISKQNPSNVLVIGTNAEIFELRCVQNCYFLVHLLEMEELWLRLMANSAPL